MDTHFINTYYILFDELCPEEAKLTVSTLANKVFTHSAQLHPAAQGNEAHNKIPSKVLVSREVQDLFIYNVSTLQYTLTTFVDIIINTEVLSQSTAGYSQFCML